MDIKLFVAAHKPSPMPDERMYQPIQVGAKDKSSISFDACEIYNRPGTIIRDDSGDNISEKNPFYCELTGVYYIWKNVEAEAVGLCHYRRYFSTTKKNKKSGKKNYNSFDDILKKEEAEGYMQEADIVIPKNNRYFIETLYSHYAHTQDGMHLDVAREVIAENYPEYLEYVDKIYSKTAGSMYNMCIMKKPLFDEYCQWLFDILGKMEERIDVAELSSFQARLFGRVSELLLNVWALKKEAEGAVVLEAPVFYTEHVNWVKKGVWFLQAKFFGKKYTKSA